MAQTAAAAVPQVSLRVALCRRLLHQRLCRAILLRRCHGALHADSGRHRGRKGEGHLGRDAHRRTRRVDVLGLVAPLLLHPHAHLHAAALHCRGRVWKVPALLLRNVVRPPVRHVFPVYHDHGCQRVRLRRPPAPLCAGRQRRWRALLFRARRPARHVVYQRPP